MAGELLALVTCPEDKGAEIARLLVEEKLVACVNIIPKVQSVYCWKGKVEQDSEALMMLKTTSEAWDRLQSRIKELHPYELPEMIFFPIQGGYQPYLDWLRSSVQVGSGSSD